MALAALLSSSASRALSGSGKSFVINTNPDSKIDTNPDSKIDTNPDSKIQDDMEFAEINLDPDKKIRIHFLQINADSTGFLTPTKQQRHLLTDHFATKFVK